MQRTNYFLNRSPFDLTLYLVANRPSFPHESLFFTKIRRAVEGGVSCVQLRDHATDASAVIDMACRLKSVLQGTPLLINTLHPIEVALAVNAEGVYLEESFPYAEARRMLGDKAIIGTSVKTIEEVLAFEGTDIDYLSVKVSPSKKTSLHNDQLWGMKGLQYVRKASSHRIVAIGGLNASCVKSVYSMLHPDDGIAMAGGLMDAEDPGVTARSIKEIWQATQKAKR